MPPNHSRTAITTDHPGSTQQEIDDEPDWAFGHNHRIGFVNSDDRLPGLTHSSDDAEVDEEAAEQIEESADDLKKEHKGELVNFRDVIEGKTDIHLKRPEDHPPGWRFYINVTEDWVKKEQPWPANKKAEQKKKQKEQEEKEKKQEESSEGKGDDQQEKTDDQKDKSSQDKQASKKDDKSQKEKSDTKQDAKQDQAPKRDFNVKEEDSKGLGIVHADDEKEEETPEKNEDQHAQKQNKPKTSSSQPAETQSNGAKAQSSSESGKDASKNSDHDNVSSKQQQKQSQASSKHPGGAEESHTKQRGMRHYWKGGDTDESDWRRKGGDRATFSLAYGRSSSPDDEGYHSGDKSGDDHSSDQDDGSSDEDTKTEYQKLRETYSPQEIALLRHLQGEVRYTQNLEQNDGKQVSPAVNNQIVEIDVNDQFTPDNWIPRSTSMIRNTGKHPMNAEAPLSQLYEAGLITPNHLHYIRNHGAVPRLYWETHTLDIENGKLVLTMDDLENDFNSINIPVAIACDGNRRGEMNLVKKSKGFSWGAAATGCAYWKGAPLRDILLAAGVDAGLSSSKRRWVNFEGADELTEGKYATCIPLEYALDPGNDVIVAYEMNNVKLPPDHGFPCRMVIPGFVGGRCVKWLSKVWTSDEENNSHYHIWDNRVMPPFIHDRDSPFATAMFNHPSTICNEQNLNSVIVKPAQGEKLTFKDAGKMDTYRVEGFAYDGGGHEIERVELSLDDGKSWLYCIRRFPEKPIRHGNKFWSWLHWYIDVDMGHLIQASSISVRAMNVFKNFQPEKLTWNLSGMMNNCWYVVRHDLDSKRTEPNSEAAIVFRHPVDPVDSEGWMKPSTEVQLAAAKADTGVPDKQFTRQEIEKHNTDRDCWLVVNEKVYDATSVLDWHPGGKASLLGYAGKLTAETTSSFESIHDDYATQKLNECIIGKLTQKASGFIKKQAKQQAEERAKSSANSDIFLKKQTWQSVKLIDRKRIADDTSSYTFQLPDKSKKLGLSTCQHIQFGFHMKDKMLIRSYTPTRPIMQDDENGTFELVIKIYFPTEEQPGGAFSNFIDTMPINECVDVRGPTGEICYTGGGKFHVEGEERSFRKVSLILGGSGITPGYQLLERVLRDKNDKTQIRVVDANKSEKDILLKDELEEMTKKSDGRIQVTHVLSHPSDEWKGLKGHVNEDIIKEHCFPPSGEGEEGGESAVFLCGPPAMIQKAALPALKDWGYEEDKNCFGF